MNVFLTAGRISIALCCCFSILAAQPKLLLVGGKEQNFGDVYTETAHFTIPLKNIGVDSLKVWNISTSCGCTAALLSNDHIAPNDSGILAITFDAKRYEGKVEKVISMTTGDPSQKYVTIKFAVNVIRTLTFDPEYVYFSTIVDSTVKETCVVYNSSKDRIRILSAKPSGSDITVYCPEKRLDPQENLPIEIIFSSSTAGTSSGNITVVTDHPKNPLFEFRYFALTKEKKFSTKIH